MKEKVCRDEVLWCLKIAVRRYSFQRSYGTAELFKCMFPDSDIASDFSLDATKTSYLTGYGLSQFFHKETVHLLKTSNSFFCFEFDKTTTNSEEKQLNTNHRFWCDKKRMIVVHYYESHFLGHADAHIL
jgi:hypothetical protein